MKKKYKVLIVLFSILFIFLIIGTPKYNSIKIKNKDFKDSQKTFDESIEKNSEIDINKIVKFEFDEVYIFTPYYPSKSIYEKLNQEWTTCSTYLGYILLHDVENESLNDDEFLMVFKKADKVVATNLYKLNNVKNIVVDGHNKLTKDNAKLVVEKNGENKIVKVK
ncbi:hypothetical protein SAMN02745163_00298 [Clostridium cavendishii DSM 21758]|uniref:Uncharacterized protein n=1 Tax=Clostridium cavendishii DSM 21758 TaxID=1121302 RepID=A0A1M6BAA1_9CLOT|nr:hypothetical protein [Clostridium cavendishii]SHI45694.1 hypothetical protein SAMN02745163_00298 [Clostridium cavendishii DSM 21758]